jgi:hypothetical protein
MERMGDVLKKSDDAERQLEQKLLREALKKDREGEAREMKEKEAARLREVNMIAELGEQMRVKQKQREQELKQNA